MWPFKKKNEFNLDSLEKELSSQDPKSLNLPNSNAEDENIEPPENYTPNTTRDDRINIAKSISNTDETISPPIGETPIKGYGNQQNPQYGYGNQFEHQTMHNIDQNNGMNMQQTNNISQNNLHKTEIIEKQIEILSSKMDLVKVNLENIYTKLSVIEQKIDKNKNTSW